jgi:hypothetical protein
MRPWEKAHLRMLETLPKRTHYRHTAEERRHGKRLGGRPRQAVNVDGKSYVSLTAAAQALGIARQTVTSMVRRGQAFME